MSINTQKITDAGVSIWLDDLSRDRLQNGSLTDLIVNKNVVGITTNPSIFQAAITGSDLYDADLAELKGATPEIKVQKLTTDDVRNACDIMKPIYDKTNGVNGRVSIEVDPRLAHDTDGTIKAAEDLFGIVARENVMIKIPATVEGLPAITAVLAKGISVNVTLIFSITRYREVMQAFLDGIQLASDAGLNISKIHSVASFFVSRVDTAVDPLLEKIDSEEALKLRGKIAVTNAKLAFDQYEYFFGQNAQWHSLEKHGAHRQRPLWASTGVKNREYSPTLYVDDLAFAGTVNTMPENTLKLLDLNTNEDRYPIDTDKSYLIDRIKKLESLGINLITITDQLEAEGVQKFIDAWQSLLDDVVKK